MIGSVLVQAVGAPITAPGFVMDAFAPANVLALEVPGSGLGNESPSFSAIATGLIGPGTWGFNLCLSLPNSVSPSVIALATGTNNTSGSLPYTVEADVTVTNGIPSGTWNLFINNVSVASGNLSNFPLVPYPTRPANGATSTTTKIRRSLVLSCNVTQVGSGYPVYNTIFSDSFQRANENPLNPTNWTTLSGGFNDLQILNNECEPSGGSSAVGAAFCTASFPSDQWAEFKINHLTSSNNGAGLFVRTTPNFNSTYYLKVIGPTNGTASARIQLRVAVTLVLDLTNQIVNVGDIFRLAAQGNVITVFQNGVSIGSITDSSFSSGRAGVRQDQDLSGQDGVINFNAGSVSNGFATCVLQVSEVTGYTGVPVTTNSN